MIEVRKLGIVRPSQRKIIDALTDPRIKVEPRIFTSEDPGANASAVRQAYHKRFCSLIEKCCRSKNTGTQAPMQKLIPAVRRARLSFRCVLRFVRSTSGRGFAVVQRAHPAIDAVHPYGGPPVLCRRCCERTPNALFGSCSL